MNAAALSRSRYPATHVDPAVRTELIAVDRCPELAADWMRLEAQAEGSPFTCWAWVSTWLALLPDTCRPWVFRASDATGTFALGLLLEAPERGIGRLFGSHSLLLQETGQAELDEITIEYAGLLVRKGAQAAGYAALFGALDAGGGPNAGWRRLRISAAAHADAVAAALPPTMEAGCVESRPSYFVDLDQLRGTGRSYYASLPGKIRGSVNQARRAYGAVGELNAQTATDARTALAWLDELAALHTRYWNGKGLPGSFASGFFTRFHRALVGAGTATGFTRITRVSAGPLLVGYIYSLLWRNRLYYYNSGLNYGAVPRHDRPGLACLHAVVEQALADGLEQFDFLAGAQDYKRRLANDARQLHWIDIRRRGLRPAGERLLARLLRRRTFGQPLAQAVADARQRAA